MTNERLNNKKTEEFQLLKVPPKRRVYKIIRVLFIRKYVLPGYAQVRSIALNHFNIPTAQSRKRRARATRYLGCTWSALDRGLLGSSIDVLDRSSVCSITLTRTLMLISSLKPHFSINDLLYTKMLKLTKTLENNKIKSLTNIS